MFKSLFRNLVFCSLLVFLQTLTASAVEQKPETNSIVEEVIADEKEDSRHKSQETTKEVIPNKSAKKAETDSEEFIKPIPAQELNKIASYSGQVAKASEEVSTVKALEINQEEKSPDVVSNDAKEETKNISTISNTDDVPKNSFAEQGIVAKEEANGDTPPLSEIEKTEEEAFTNTPAENAAVGTEADPEVSPSNILEKSDVENSVVRPSNQELIDSALDYWQTSNEFWEHGELNNAIDSLDNAYSLILKVENEPEFLQQKEDLRITIAKQIVEVYSSRFTVANGMYKAIPLEMNKHVRKAINLFQGRNRKFFMESYVRSGKYRPAIVRALKEAGLPEELSWLPLIESGFKVRALSSARALGMWQFIASTGYKFGLKRDTWIDERMDPEKSTKGAIAYLTELHNIFGDWTTALAGYNCGEHRVLRKINAQKIGYLDNFWDLYNKLPSETAFYVPKFLAVLHIINDPETYGFELPPVDEELKVDIIAINKQASLKTIAKSINVAIRELKNMNPELRQGVTPNAPYSIKVPEGKGELLLTKIEKIPVYSPPLPLYISHRVRFGESLSGIADRYKTSVSSIMRVNNIKRRSYIKAGWKLKIPTSRYVRRKAVNSSSLASIEKGKEGKYIVKKGDSLTKIANKYQTTVNAIKVSNKLKNSSLLIGQVLTISSDRTIAMPSGINVEYRVKKGDSPYLIAKRYKMGISNFLTLNSLTAKSTIYPGQKVVVQVKSL